MATVEPISEPLPAAEPAGASLLVSIAAMPADKVDKVIGRLLDCFPAGNLIVATPDASPDDNQPLRIVPIPATTTSWVLTATDFANVYQVAQQHNVQAVLMLGQESDSLTATALTDLCAATLHPTTDLAIPFYDLPARAGLVNASILYPMSRSLFASRVRFPLAIDLGLSMRMLARLATTAGRYTALNQGETLLWPVSEAASAGYTIEEVEVGPRILPHPGDADLNTILARVTASLFTDVETKAAFWQRARPLPSARTPIAQPLSAEPASDTASMLDAFRLAYTNLREIWSLVLTPNSLLGLKRLYASDPATFHMPDALWARIIFDFLLAYRLRTINRGHLLGALTPLYLAWVASHINVIASGVDAERSIEALAATFESEKPYLVSRWRWPDRFNP